MAGEIPVATANLECRMYEAKYPEVDDVVMVKVKSIAEMGAYVSLLEYNNIEGMILLSELSRRRIRSVNKLIRVGRMEVVTVVRVDKDKGYIDLSKRRVQQEDIIKMENKWNKSKAVHSIMKHVAKRVDMDTEELYRQFGWPLYKKYGHCYDAFKLIVADPEKVFADFPKLPAEVKEEIQVNVERRLTPQAVKIRADIELTCFTYEGIDAIKEALMAGVNMSEPEFEVSIKLVAPPLYVVTATAMDKDDGIMHTKQVCEAISKAIAEKGGNMAIKHEARAITDRDEDTLAAMLQRLTDEQKEIDGDDDGDELA
jgi:translation initiation factor 2 subunit 1